MMELMLEVETTTSSNPLLTTFVLMVCLASLLVEVRSKIDGPGGHS
jgi:hypothetical protein